MNDTELQSSPITLDRRLVLGEIDYQVTAFPAEDHRIDLCIVSSDGDGQVVSEISGGIAPSDLTALTDVLTSTLSGLIAMTQPALSSRSPSARPDRPPNRGTRWTEADDTRLITRYRAGGRLRDLTDEFGRTAGGIRARLEFLGVLAPGAPWQSTPAQPASDQPVPAGPASGRPASGRPASDRPASGRPASDRPASARPAAGQPASGRPASARPAAGQAASGRPAAGQAASGRPASDRPTSGQFAPDQGALDLSRPGSSAVEPRPGDPAPAG